MAKTPAKPKAAKTTTATEKKKTSAKSDPAKKESPAKKKAAPKKAVTSKTTATPAKKTPAAKKPAASRATDPGAELAKQCQQVATKLDKMEGHQFHEIKEKLEWCLGSYNYDKNPAGLADYGKQAVEKLKEARQEKPRQISQKLIDNLEEALAKF